MAELSWPAVLIVVIVAVVVLFFSRTHVGSQRDGLAAKDRCCLASLRATKRATLRAARALFGRYWFERWHKETLVKTEQIWIDPSTRMTIAHVLPSSRARGVDVQCRFYPR